MRTSKTGGTPLLTAIIPVHDVFNRIGFLQYWLENCRNQEIEIILVHDSSSEPELKSLKTSIAKLNLANVMILNVEFNSPGLSRNAGLKLVSTPYVCFWDSDDLPQVQKVLKLTRTLQPEVDILIGQFNVKNLVTGKEIVSTTVDGSLISICCTNPGVWRMIFASHLFNEIKFSEHRIAEDQLLLAELELPRLNCSITQELVYSYNQHENVRLTNSSAAFPELLVVQEKIIDLLRGQSEGSLSITYIFLVRVTISAIKRLPIKLKIILSKNILILSLRPKNLLAILKSLKLILRFRQTKK